MGFKMWDIFITQTFPSKFWRYISGFELRITEIKMRIYPFIKSFLLSYCLLFQIRVLMFLYTSAGMKLSLLKLQVSHFPMTMMMHSIRGISISRGFAPCNPFLLCSFIVFSNLNIYIAGFSNFK